MKKFLIILVGIIVVNLSCSKDKLCGCSPNYNPTLNLVVKNTIGDDLLSPTSSGYFSMAQIQLYYLGANGNQVPVRFSIRPKFSYGNNQFLYQTIFSEEIAGLAKGIDQSFFLKLGSNAPIELNLQVNNTTRRLDKLLINKLNSPADNALTSYVDIFYLVL